MLHPETITPPEKPLGLVKGLLAGGRNPIEAWPAALYREPYVRFTIAGRVFLMIADPDMAKTVLLDRADAFGRSTIADRILRPALGDGLLTADGESWRAQRRIAAPAFRQSVLDGLVPVMSAAGRACADRLAAADGARVDVMAEMTRATADVILATLLGGEDSGLDTEALAADVADYLDTTGRAGPFDLLGLPEWLPQPWKARGRRAAKRLRAAVAEMVARYAAREKSADAPMTLTGALIAAQDPQSGVGMSDAQLIDNVLTFVTAGHETTALALTWTLSILAKLPALQDELAAETAAIVGDGPVEARHIEALKLHERVISEAMRLYPPVAIIGRTVTEPVELGGVALAPGDQAQCVIYVIQRHERLWEEPSGFNPDRFLPEAAAARHRYAYMPFGAGPRICIGMRFAMMEATAILAEVVRAVRVAPDPDHRIRPVMTVTMRPEGGMPLYVRARA